MADVVLVAAGLAQLPLYWPMYGKEDALICYRYARNWVQGQGLVYNPGEYVEGFSNLLWTFQIALFHWAGLSMDGADNLLIFTHTALALVLLLWVCVRAFGNTWAARLPLFLVVCMTAVPASFGNGLEGSATSVAVLLLLVGALSLRPAVLAAGAVMMMLLRPEGPAYAGWAFLWLFAVTWREPEQRRKAFLGAVATAAGFAALTGFRLAYYGDYLPNTVRAKENGVSGQVLLVAGKYLVQYAWSVGPLTLFLALVAATAKRWRALWLFTIGLVALNMAVVCGNGGDWMNYFRLLTPFYALIAFLAGAGALVLLQRHRRLAPVLVIAGLAAGAWSVLPQDLLLKVRELSYRWPAKVPVSCGGTSLFDEHIQLQDVGQPDDRWVVEYGGWDAYLLEGVRVTELWGLTDREIARGSGPGTIHFPGGGRICWPATFAKHPTYMVFSTGAFCQRMASIAATPGLREVMDGYMVVQDRSVEAQQNKFNLFVARCDRKPMAAFMLHSGALTPAADYASPEFHGGPQAGEIKAGGVLGADKPLRTAWQESGWTDGRGKLVPTEWMDWDDDLRLSSRLLLDRGVNRFVRDLSDDSPLVFVVGRFPLLVPNLRMRVIAIDKDGGERVVAQAELSEPSSAEFVLAPLAVPGWMGGTPVCVAVELEADEAGAVFLAAHRWARAPLPELPPRFVADTHLFRAPCGLSGAPDGGDEATLAEKRRRVDADPGYAPKRLELAAALARRENWTEAEVHLRRALSLERGAWAAGTRLFAEEAERRAGKGDPRGAADMLRLARGLEPADLAHALRLAQMLTEFGELDGALAQCRELLGRVPESPRTSALLDRICEMRGGAAERVTEWRAIVEKQPNAELPWRHLADALAQSGDQDGAKAARERAEKNAAQATSR